MILVNVILFVGIFSRMIPYQVMVSSLPEQTQRGAFTAISSSTQSLAGGISSLVAGHIVSLGADGKLHHFTTVGYVVVCTTLISVFLVWKVQQGMQAHAAVQAAKA